MAGDDARTTTPTDGFGGRFYGRKVIRDLLWAVSSPHLISAEQFPVLPPDFGFPGGDHAETQRVILRQWLDDLHAEPRHLVAFLQEKTKTKSTALALGVYFASLLEYWLRFCPLLRVGKFEVGKQIVSATNLTLGQLKFLFRVHHDDTTPAQFQDFHVESSVKFFLLHPLDDRPPPHSNSPRLREDSAEAPLPYPLEQFVGPHLGENLAWRVQEVARKLDMCRGESVQSWLREQYSDDVASRIVLRGYLFHPLSHFQATSHVTLGHDWAFHRNPTADGSTVPANARHNPSVDVKHLRGWWTSDIDTEFPSKVQANACESRFVVLPKLHWLSPVIATEDRHSGRVLVAGDPDVLIDSVEALTLDELLSYARDHFRASKHSIEAQAKGGVVMPMLVAEIVRCRPCDVEYDDEVLQWKELSRGFLLDPKSWDPVPLCQDAVRFKRTTVSLIDDGCEREYEGRRGWAKDGMIRPTDEEAELARLRKQHSFTSPATITGAQMVLELTAILSEHKTFTHVNLKSSIRHVLTCRTQDKAADFILECLTCVTKQGVKGDTKTSQRLGHLILDAMEDVELSTDTRVIEAFIDLFLSVAGDETRWSYLNLSVRACERIRVYSGGLFMLRSSRLLEAMEQVLMTFAARRNSKWNCITVEIIRVFFVSSEIGSVLQQRLLDGFIEQEDWKSAELLVTISGDTELASVLVRCFAALNMTKALKRLKKACSRRHRDIEIEAGDVHVVGPTIDVQSNQRGIKPTIPPLQWSLVDCETSLGQLMSTLLAYQAAGDVTFVGLDCEWRPMMQKRDPTSLAHSPSDSDDETDSEEGIAENEGVSLYQLAIGDHTFVVDVQTLGAPAATPLQFIWTLGSALVLVGFSVSEDLRRLNRSFPDLLLPCTGQGELDECLFVELKQLALYRQIPASKWGLSQLHEFCFGESICKEQQCSDWGIRPLSREQLEYAAMDAYAVRNIALLLSSDIREDILPLMRRFAVVTDVSATEAQLGHWTASLRPLSTSDVRAALLRLRQSKVARSILKIDSDSWTGEAHMEQGLLVKTIAIVLRSGGYRTDGTLTHFLAVVLRVDETIDMDRLAQHLRVPQGDLSLADRSTLIRVFGYRRGGVGPLGLREQAAVQVVLDAALMLEVSILCGAGQEDVVYPISPSSLRDLTNADVVDVSLKYGDPRSI